MITLQTAVSHPASLLQFYSERVPEGEEEPLSLSHSLTDAATRVSNRDAYAGGSDLVSCVR